MEKDNLEPFETMAQMASNHEPPVFLWITISPFLIDIIDEWLPEKPFTNLDDYFNHYGNIFSQLEDWLLLNHPDTYTIYKNGLEYMGLSDLHKLLFACLLQYNQNHPRKLMVK